MKTFILAMAVAFFMGFVSGTSYPAEYVGSARNMNATTVVKAGPPTVMVTALAEAASSVDATNSSFQDVSLMLGSSGNEGTVLIIPALTSRLYPLSIAKGARISINSLGTAIATGSVILNLFGNSQM